MSRQPSQRSAPVRIHIDRLVVHGLQRGEISQLGPKLAQELQRLLSEQGVPPGLNRSLQLRNLNTQPMRLKKKQDSRQVARQLAVTVYQGLNRV